MSKENIAFETVEETPEERGIFDDVSIFEKEMNQDREEAPEHEEEEEEDYYFQESSTASEDFTEEAQLILNIYNETIAFSCALIAKNRDTKKYRIWSNPEKELTKDTAIVKAANIVVKKYSQLQASPEFTLLSLLLLATIPQLQKAFDERTKARANKKKPSDIDILFQEDINKDAKKEN